MPRMRPAFPGAKITTTAGTSTPTAIPSGSQGFWVNFSAAGFCKVTGASESAAFTMNAGNSGPMAAGLYGPFEFSHSDRYVHVAGDGGTPVATITFV